MAILIIIFIALIFGSAFFSSSETALFSLSRVQLLRLKSSKSTAARQVASMLRKPRPILTTILLGNEFVNVCISIVGAAIIGRVVFGSAEMETLVAILVITPIVLIFGEIIPKSIALRFAWKSAQKLIKPLKHFHKLTSPIRKVLVLLSDGIIKAIGGKPDVPPPVIMEEEYRRLVDQSIEHGTLVEEERELIHNVFEFGNKEVEDIMTPRNHIFSISTKIPYKDLLNKIGASNHSRIPVFEKNFDNVIGILHRRDLFALHRRKIEGTKKELNKILRAPLFVSPRENLDELLHRFQASQMHLALVKQRKKIVGLVTLDDVLEELVGEMGD